MPRARTICPVPGCPEITTGGRCAAHTAEIKRKIGTAAARGYGATHRTRFRPGVLARNPWCVLCSERATIPDHWPLSRRDLVARGMDPDDPRHGCGLCASCHGVETARNQPGGWNARL